MRFSFGAAPGGDGGVERRHHALRDAANELGVPVAVAQRATSFASSSAIIEKASKVRGGRASITGFGREGGITSSSQRRLYSYHTPTQPKRARLNLRYSIPFFFGKKHAHSCASCVVVCLTVESVGSQGALDAGGHEHKVKSSGERHLLHRLTEQPQSGRGAEARCEEFHGGGVLGLRKKK